jgi:hypothetical protein
MDLKGACPVCAKDYRNLPPVELVINGRTEIVPQAFAGALDWSPYVMLQLTHRDWLRPLGGADDGSLPGGSRPSSHVLVVLIFWTYFEALKGWFYETATGELPPSVAADLLNRYGSIGARLHRLHRILFGTKYADDLPEIGYADIGEHLKDIQRLRNMFVHGNPESISDAAVEQTVALIPKFHEA